MESPNNQFEEQQQDGISMRKLKLWSSPDIVLTRMAYRTGSKNHGLSLNIFKLHIVSLKPYHLWWWRMVYDCLDHMIFKCPNPSRSSPAQVASEWPKPKEWLRRLFKQRVRMGFFDPGGPTALR